MTIKNLRKEIDRIDAELSQLLLERLEVSVRTKRFKTAVEDVTREEEVRQRAKERAHGLFSEQLGEKLQTLFIEESKRLQREEMTLVAFHGEHGSFSEEALLKCSADTLPKPWYGIPADSISEIFEAVETGSVDFCIVPIENSVDSLISEVEQKLIETSLSIVGEVSLVLNHSLLTLPETDYRDIREVYGTPAALSLCSEYIKRHKLEAHPYFDSASAALRMIREQKPASAVIASVRTQNLYRLSLIKENIQERDIATRYIVLGKKSSLEGLKSSIAFTIEHKKGILLKALQVFEREGINLLRIESRTLNNKALFFLDFEGAKKDLHVEHALNELSKFVEGVRFFGSYIPS